MSTSGTVELQVRDQVATILFNRPDRHNAMTWSMYESLSHYCEQIATDPSVRVAVLRGHGGKAFVAGTDIEQFQAFKTGEDGVAYERKIDRLVDQVEQLPIPTIAVIEGWCMGGGMAIASACDFRLGTPHARFGVPIARTLGNCLSLANTRRLAAGLGVAGAKRMLLGAETLDGQDALDAGFLYALASPEEIEKKTEALCRQLSALAPLTQHAAKAMIREVMTRDGLDTDALIAGCYGSADFREGVDSFMKGRPAVWSGS